MASLLIQRRWQARNQTRRPRRVPAGILMENPYLLWPLLGSLNFLFFLDDLEVTVLCLTFFFQFASLGGFLFGYDQGVVSGVLTMESFGARFPRIYLDSSFTGWFVSSLLLLAWFGSLANGAIADRFGRKGSMLWRLWSCSSSARLSRREP